MLKIEMIAKLSELWCEMFMCAKHMHLRGLSSINDEVKSLIPEAKSLGITFRDIYCHLSQKEITEEKYEEIKSTIPDGDFVARLLKDNLE